MSAGIRSIRCDYDKVWGFLGWVGIYCEKLTMVLNCDSKTKWRNRYLQWLRSIEMKRWGQNTLIANAQLVSGEVLSYSPHSHKPDSFCFVSLATPLFLFGFITVVSLMLLLHFSHLNFHFFVIRFFIFAWRINDFYEDKTYLKFHSHNRWGGANVSYCGFPLRKSKF